MHPARLNISTQAAVAALLVVLAGLSLLGDVGQARSAQRGADTPQANKKAGDDRKNAPAKNDNAAEKRGGATEDRRPGNRPDGDRPLRGKIRERIEAQRDGKPRPSAQPRPVVQQGNKDRQAFLARPLTPEDVGEIIEIMKLRDPELAQRFARMFENDPEQAMKVIRQNGQRLRLMLYMKRQEPEAFALRSREAETFRRIRHLARQAVEARVKGDSDKVASLRGELREALVEHFEIRQAARRLELQKLHKRVEELQSHIEQQSAAKERLIERQISKWLNAPKKSAPGED